MAGTVPDYEAWDACLKAHVMKGVKDGVELSIINYKGVQGDPQFAQFISSLENANTNGLSKPEGYALWINAYNALAVKLVLDHGCPKDILGNPTPITSINDISSLLHPALKTAAGVVGGKQYSLDDILEQELTAPKMYPADPRFHACIVAGSVSCPDLAPKAYRPETIEEDLASGMRCLLGNPTKGLQLHKEEGVLRLSRIFDLYSGEFTMDGTSATVIEALIPYMPKDTARIIMEEFSSAGTNKQLNLAYFECDGRLNGDPPCP